MAGTNWIGFWTLITREVGRFFSVYRQTVLPGLISSGLYILVFGFTLERRIAEINGVPYTLFILVSDFIRTRKDIDRRFKMMGSKFETIAVMIRDKMDEDLPETNYQIAVQDPYTGKQVILDPDIASEKFRISVLKHKGMLKDLFRKSKIDLLELNIEKSFAIPISSFLENRAKGGRI